MATRGSSEIVIEEVAHVLDPRVLEDLMDRLVRARLPAVNETSWDKGTPVHWLCDLVADWQTHDFANLHARLDAMRHLVAQIDSQSVHFLQFPGAGPRAAPLVLTHGWPSSFLEFLDVAALLCDPAAHGSDASDAFTVIVPSLPGFGFSGAPPEEGLTPRSVAAFWHIMLTNGLGYEKYFAHGGDLGAGITAWLARDFPDAVAAIHLATPGLAAPPRPWSTAEEAFFDQVARWTAEEGAYAHQQGTKPLTLGAALLDSPLGLAAWVGEKVIAWSSTNQSGDPTFPRRLLLDTLTLYWCTRTIATSFLPYWRYRHDPTAAIPVGGVTTVPTSVGVYGGERVPFPKPPRELAERYFNIVSWDEYDTGGHFPAIATPQLLAENLRVSFRPYREAELP